MITPEQFKVQWERGEFRGLISFPSACLADVLIPEDDKDFLVRTGLPSDAAPFLSFGPGKGKTLERVSEVWMQPASLSRYRVIGSNGSGDPVCLDEVVPGQVVYLNHDDKFKRVLMASSLPKLAECLLTVRDFISEVGGIADPLQESKLTGLRMRLASIDPESAATKDSFWQSEVSTFL